MGVSEIKCNNSLKATQYKVAELGTDARNLTPELTAQPLGWVALIWATCPEGNEAMCLSFLQERMEIFVSCFMAANSVPTCSRGTSLWTSPPQDQALPFSPLTPQFKTKGCSPAFWGKWGHERRDLSSHCSLMTSHPSPWHLTRTWLEKNGEKRITNRVMKQNSLARGMCPCAFPKRGEYAWLRTEAHNLTFGHHTELCILFSVRNKACDLNVFRYTFVSMANVYIYIYIFSSRNTREQKSESVMAVLHA